MGRTDSKRKFRPISTLRIGEGEKKGRHLELRHSNGQRKKGEKQRGEGTCSSSSYETLGKRKHGNYRENHIGNEIHRLPEKE